jgi:hypothetical protein
MARNFLRLIVVCPGSRRQRFWKKRRPLPKPGSYADWKNSARRSVPAFECRSVGGQALPQANQSAAKKEAARRLVSVGLPVKCGFLEAIRTALITGIDKTC